MKSSRMKFAKKLKSIKASEYLNQDRFLHMLTATEGITEYLPKITNPISQITAGSIWRSPQKLEDHQIAMEKEVKEVEVEEEDENIPPPVNQIPRDSCDRKDSKPVIISCGRKSLGSGFRRPDLNSNTLFDPKLLEAFELAVKCYRRINDFSVDEDDVICLPEFGNDEKVLPPVIAVEEEGRQEYENDAQQDNGNLEKDDTTLQIVVAVVEEECPNVGNDEKALSPVMEDRQRDENVICSDAQQGNVNFVKDDNTLQIEECGNDGNALVDPLLEFEERCPPGGEESVVFYTTSLRGIRKTFDDCNMIRFLLDSFKVKYYERDVSMHRQYREELRRVSSVETEVLPPVLFVKGRCIGGAQRVFCLHEQGKLKVLFEGVPMAGEERCGKCDGFRFVMCEGCRGSRRIVSGDGTRVQCLLCNENGLIVCGECSL